jgi:hypothetical protein
MTYRLTSAQRCVLADCTRTALVGWLVTDPAVEGKARRIQYKATGILGFGFSRFVTMAVRWTPALRQVAMRESCSYKRLRNRSSQ